MILMTDHESRPHVFSGPQRRNAMREHREAKRIAAIARNALTPPELRSKKRRKRKEESK